MLPTEAVLLHFTQLPRFIMFTFIDNESEPNIVQSGAIPVFFKVGYSFLTNSAKRGSSLILVIALLSKKFPSFYATGGFGTGFCSEPDESNCHIQTLFLQDPF